MADEMISSFEQYIHEIRNIIKNNFSKDDLPIWENAIPWFRGQDVDKPLIPKLFRDEYKQQKENDLLQIFRMKSQALDKTPNYERIDEWLFLMQHHRLPTRLLDWTESPLIALFFAINSEKHMEEIDPIIWVLDQFQLNLCSTRIHTLPLSWIGNYDENKKEEYDLRGLRNFQAAFSINEENATDLPVALKPQYIHKRLLAQKSCFTIHGKKHEAIEELMPDLIRDNFLIKFKINRLFIDEIKKDLKLFGITYSTVFPDLEGLSKDLCD